MTGQPANDREKKFDGGATRHRPPDGKKKGTDKDEDSNSHSDTDTVPIATISHSVNLPRATSYRRVPTAQPKSEPSSCFTCCSIS